MGINAPASSPSTQVWQRYLSKEDSEGDPYCLQGRGPNRTAKAQHGNLPQPTALNQGLGEGGTRRIFSLGVCQPARGLGSPMLDGASKTTFQSWVIRGLGRMACRCVLVIRNHGPSRRSDEKPGNYPCSLLSPTRHTKRVPKLREFSILRLSAPASSSRL